MPQRGRPPRPHHRRARRGRTAARPVDRRLRAGRRGGGTLGPRRPARRGAQRRPRPSGAVARHRAHRHQQRPLRHTGTLASRHRHGGRAGTPPSDRARGVASPRRRGPPALRDRAGTTVRPVARSGGTGGGTGSGVRVRPPSGGAQIARVCGAAGPHRADLAGGAGAARCHRPLRTPGWRARGRSVGTDPSRARGDRHPRLRRLLPHRLGHRRVLPAREHLLPGARLCRQLRRLLRARDHPGGRRVARPLVRTLPLPRTRRPPGHRHRHRVRPARRGHRLRLRTLRPLPRRPGGQRHHLPGPLRHPRRRQGARSRKPGRRWTPGPSRSTANGDPLERSSTAPAQRWPPWSSRSSTSRAISASIPEGWSSATGRSSTSVPWNGPACRGGVLFSGTRRTAPLWAS